MADPQILSTLRKKRNEIEGTIAAYEKRIEAARHGLAAVAATIRLFELTGEPQEFPAYAATGRLRRRGEMVAVCRAALAAEGPLDTRELAVRVLRAKGLDQGDKVLRQTVTFKIVQALSMAAKRGTIGEAGKRKGVRVWHCRSPLEELNSSVEGKRGTDRCLRKLASKLEITPFRSL